jgi:tripartite-type tricarboxylate transporter receptor subunit TctC
VSVVAEVPEVLVSHPAAPFASFREFVDYAKKNPGKLNYSSAGIGTLPHITFELLLRRTGIEVAHIPYRGAAPAMTDLLAGVVQLKLDTYATSNAHVAAGKLRMLGIASRHRSKLMPDTPTIAEMGLPGYEGVLWIALMAPGGTPQAVIDRLAAASAKAARAPDVAEKLQRDGVDPIGGTPQELGAMIARELPQWRELAKAANIKLQ